MRKFLDTLYNASGFAAAGFIVIICLVVSAQVVLNLITKTFGSAYSMTIPSYATFYMFRLNYESYDYGDLSNGIIAIPLWIPQLATSAGLLMLTIAFIDLFVATIITRAPVLENMEQE